MKIILFLIIGILQSLITIIPTKGKVSDNRNRFYKFTNLGWKLVLCIIISLTCTFILFCITEEESNRKEKLHETKELQASKDYSKLLDSTNKKNLIIYTEVLAKYGLKYDSSQNIIAKLVKDSTKKVVTIINGEDPVLMLCSGIGIDDVYNRSDTLFLKINLCSDKSTSKVIELKVTTLGSMSDYRDISQNDFKLLGKDKIIQKNSYIESNSISGIEMNYSPVPIFNMIYIRIYGSFSKVDNSKTTLIDRIYGYDLKNRKFGTAMPETIERIKKFLSTK